MRDYISIGSSPTNEDCVSVNPQGDYHDAMKAECRRFLELIRKKLGPEPPGAYLAVKGNPHDFGTYYEVVCYYDDEDEDARHYAFRCEDQAPITWTDDHLTPKEEAEERNRQAEREGLCRECGEKVEDPDLFWEHVRGHILDRQAGQAKSQAA